MTKLTKTFLFLLGLGLAALAFAATANADPLSDLEAANPAVTNPDLIIVGQTLQLDGAPYVVAPGDTLTKLSLRTATPPAAPLPPAPPAAPQLAPAVVDAAYAPPAPAPARHSVNWDAVAACESGGNWGINTGNSFEGGLQFLNSTWLSVKAPGDPQHAYQATSEAQMAAAERLLARSGIGQWPVCGKRG